MPYVENFIAIALIIVLFVSSYNSPNRSVVQVSPHRTMDQKIRIQDLIQLTARQQEEWKVNGAPDGTGMLFQRTPAYKELASILNNDELLIIDLLYGPPAHAIPIEADH